MATPRKANPAPAGYTAAGVPIAQKFKTEAEMRALFKAACEHLEAGLDQASFTLCGWETVTNYCRRFPQIFESKKLALAKAKGQKWFENTGKLGMLGKVKNFNATAWIFFMKNKYGYRDKQDIIVSTKTIKTGLPKSAFITNLEAPEYDDDIPEAPDRLNMKNKKPRKKHVRRVKK